MRSMTSYQEPIVLGEGLAYGYMMRLKMLESAVFDIKSSATDFVPKQIRNNDPSAVSDPVSTVIINQNLLINDRRSVPICRPEIAYWRTI